MADLDAHVQCIADADGAWRVEMRGEIDLNAQRQLDDALAQITAAAPAAVVVDLSGVTFLASNGLGFLAAIGEHAKLAGHTVTMSRPNHVAHRALTVVGFDRLYPIVTDPSEQMNAVDAAG